MEMCKPPGPFRKKQGCNLSAVFGQAQAGPNKGDKQGMGLVGAALEFGMVLHADIERMVVPLDNLNEPSVRRETGEDKSRGGERFAVFVVEFIAVAVALGDVLRAVAFFQKRSGHNVARIRAETERAALGDLVALAGHEVDNAVGGALERMSTLAPSS